VAFSPLALGALKPWASATHTYSSGGLGGSPASLKVRLQSPATHPAARHSSVMALSRKIASLIVFQLLLRTTGPAAAADWVVQSIAGPALVRDDEEWLPLVAGEILTEPFTLRTLSRGRVSVGTTDAALSLRSNSTATVTSQSKLVTVELLQGGASSFVQGGRKALLSAGLTQVVLAAGSAEIETSPRGVRVLSREGLVTVRDPTAEGPVLLAPGEGSGRPSVDSDRRASPGSDNNRGEGEAGSGGAGNSPESAGGRSNGAGRP
jgi:hypothetical protein